MRVFRRIVLPCAALLASTAISLAYETRPRSVRITTQPGQSIQPMIEPVELPRPRDIDSSLTNPSGLAIQIIPKSTFAIGENMSLRVTTRKAGYLVVFDLDATGKLSQIFPNAISMSDPAGIRENGNLIAPSKALSLPETAAATPYQFVASEPFGTGMVVALLSDKPLQFIDLPELPATISGPEQALQFIRDTTKQLKIIPDTDQGRVEVPKWSITSATYTVR